MFSRGTGLSGVEEETSSMQLNTRVLISPLPDQEGKKLQRQRF